MKTLYFDCGMGAAGDMLDASLLELIPDRQGFISKMNALGIPNVEIHAEDAEKCGIRGTHYCVSVGGEEEESHDVSKTHGENAHSHQDMHNHEHHHSHSSMEDIKRIISSLNTSENAKKNILAVYDLLAKAESHVHGVPVSEIHFHEVGTKDAIADIAAFCMLIDEIAPDRIIVSPVRTGFGLIRCAHGILPVPAPATACLLEGIPVYAGEIEGEMCTPTGAALIRYFADDFGTMPEISINKIGYGMGKKDFGTANCVRAISGESYDKKNTDQPVKDSQTDAGISKNPDDKKETAETYRNINESAAGGTKTPQEFEDTISELVCNLDDMTPEAIGFARDIFFEEGALEVYTVAADMKKNRPGVLLTVMCKTEDKEKFVRLIFQYTTSIGLREIQSRRYILKRKISEIDTSFGPVNEKISEGYGVRKSKIEYDELAKIAKENHMSLSDVIKQIEQKTTL